MLLAVSCEASVAVFAVLVGVSAGRSALAVAVSRNSSEPETAITAQHNYLKPGNIAVAGLSAAPYVADGELDGEPDGELETDAEGDVEGDADTDADGVLDGELEADAPVSTCDMTFHVLATAAANMASEIPWLAAVRLPAAATAATESTAVAWESRIAVSCTTFVAYSTLFACP